MLTIAEMLGLPYIYIYLGMYLEIDQKLQNFNNKGQFVFGQKCFLPDLSLLMGKKGKKFKMMVGYPWIHPF